MKDLRYDQETHFAFGKNWLSYLTTLTDQEIEIAMRDLAALIPPEKIRGASFCDIGCGSGLHSLCALKLGAKSLTALDFDPDSVKATAGLLGKSCAPGSYKVTQGNILTLESREKYDIVYSWGVLHHTGAMWDAVRAASNLVGPGGTLAIALYQKTRFCGIWKVLKRFYNKSGPGIRRVMKSGFSILRQLKLVLTGNNPKRFIAEYKQRRGMDWDHDIIDWLGGYPYESATPEEVITFVEALGFKFSHGSRLNKKIPLGFFGSGCGEFVFQRK